MSVQKLREVEVPGPVPRFEVPGWWQEFGVRAGVTGRGDGSGRGFDMGLWSDAPVGEVIGRWRQFRGVYQGFPGVVLGGQVHGVRIGRHGSIRGWTQIDGLDGHLTTQAGVFLTVTVADCIPVYLLAPAERAASLLHCGWRGTAGGLLQQGVRALHEATGVAVDNLVMHCGVGICGACYEVGSEVMEGCGQVTSGSGPWNLDLRSVLVEAAQRAGVHRISTSQWCSSHDRPRFYSHRGSRGQDGRMVAYLGYPQSGADHSD
jgi:copper oxidase (laccase) domain-containing protein